MARVNAPAIAPSGNVGCENHTNIQVVTALYTIPSGEKPRADKKAELIKLLHQSLKNEATTINGERHAPVLDLKLEQKIKRLASDIAKESP